MAYNFSMAAEPEPFDISAMPELVTLTDEVSHTQRPRRLVRNGKTVALLVPTPANVRRQPRHVAKTTANPDAFRATAGGWADVDVDAFLEANRASRAVSTRPVPDL